MCQIARGNRSGAEEISPSPLSMSRRSFPKTQSIESCRTTPRFCPVTGKCSVTPGEAAKDEPVPSRQLSAGKNKRHRCFVCSHFQEIEASKSVSSSCKMENVLPVFKVLRRSTQPAHLLVMVAVITLAVLFYPARKTTFVLIDEIQPVESTLWPLVYLSSFSILFGAQMWMTFISGLVLLFILPRHTFACVQSALFPKYMILNGVTAIAALVGFVQIKKTWSFQENYQIVGLMINCLCPLVTRVIVVPSLLERIRAKVMLERAAGHGPEAGPKLTSTTAAVLRQCSLYRHACRRFRQLHAVVATVNIVTLACNAFHLYYLATKLAVMY